MIQQYAYSFKLFFFQSKIAAPPPSARRNAVFPITKSARFK
jgi:hypothetical protein